MMAFVQYDPLIQHGEAKVYDEPKLDGGTVYAMRSKGGLPSKQFRGYVWKEVYNVLNGRWMYQLNIRRKYDKTGVHDNTWLYFDDVIEVDDE